MMRDAVINVGVAQRGSGVARLVGLLVVVGAVVALLWAVVSALGAAEQAVMFQDPGYRAATERASAAQADLAAAKAEHDAASIRHSQAIEASWDPISAGVVHLVGLGLLVVVPLVLLLATGLLLRRHLSLPTRDGRVAVVGLDRELSREALIRYQLRELAGVATYEALPAKSEESPISAIAGDDQSAELLDGDAQLALLRRPDRAPVPGQESATTAGRAWASEHRSAPG